MKFCSECQAEFQPTNNRQLACPSCKTAREVRIKRERRQTNPEVAQRVRDAVANYKTRNRDKVIQSYRDRYWNNPEFHRQRGTNYQAKRRQDPEYRNQMVMYLREYRILYGDEINRKQRHKYATDPDYRDRILNKVLSRKLCIDRRILLERYNYTCQYCGDTNGPFHIDHMMPLARGGSNTIDNLTVACKTCNLRKHTLTDEEFRARLR